jgi:hypothetical protein
MTASTPQIQGEILRQFTLEKSIIASPPLH